MQSSHCCLAAMFCHYLRMLLPADAGEQMAQMRQQAADQADSLAVAHNGLDQLAVAHQSLQQQLQVKVLDLQQTQDSLEERTRQHRQLLVESELQAVQLSQLRAELQGSAQEVLAAKHELAERTCAVSGVLQLSLLLRCLGWI